MTSLEESSPPRRNVWVRFLWGDIMNHKTRSALAAAALCATLFGSSAAKAEVRYLDEMFEVERSNGLSYGSAWNSRTNSEQELILDLYQPAGDTANARPAIVWVHGGSFYNGSRTSSSAVTMANAMAKRGYVNVSIDYRKLQTSGSLQSNGDLYFDTWLTRSEAVDAAQHDAQAAVRWLRANAAEYRIDIDRISIGGMSAGAITALQVAYNPEDAGASGNSGYSSEVSAAISVSGFAAVRDMEPLSAPALMFHGTSDAVVPLPLHSYTCAVATANLSGCEQTLYPGAGHVPMEHSADMIMQTANFLCRRVIENCATAASPPVRVHGVN